VNPQGVQVSGFKVPSAEELDHDYLWRYACRLPARGDIGIFNRSHYEEVLVVRVHPEHLDRQKLPAEAKGKGVWERRYREINDWERYLTDNGFKLVKLFLNLSKEEQRTRFFKRLDLPEKNWKFSAADVRERQRWDDYQRAFSQMLSATSTDWAPWYVIPADRKWFARICAAAVLAHTLIEIDPQYPEVTATRREELLAVKGELQVQAPKGAPADPFAAKQAKQEAKIAKKAKKAAAKAGRGRSKPAQRQRPARLPGTGTGLRRAGVSRRGRAAPGAGRLARTGQRRRPRGPAGPPAARPLEGSRLSRAPRQAGPKQRLAGLADERTEVATWRCKSRPQGSQPRRTDPGMRGHPMR
jgi:PPK2 family polyphosphate:nucleotide phosphotransferase